MLVKICIAVNSELPHWTNLAICQQEPILYWRWHNIRYPEVLFWKLPLSCIIWSPLIKPPFQLREIAAICLRKPLQWKAWHDNIAIKLPSPFPISGNMLCLGQTFWNTQHNLWSLFQMARHCFGQVKALELSLTRVRSSPYGPTGRHCIPSEARASDLKGTTFVTERASRPS